MKISDKVTQTMKGGAFGCPTAKVDLSFPEATRSGYAVAKPLQAVERSPTPTAALAAFIAGLVGLGFGLFGFMRAGKLG